jgi:hypothetical protein
MSGASMPRAARGYPSGGSKDLQDGRCAAEVLADLGWSPPHTIFAGGSDRAGRIKGSDLQEGQRQR